MVSKLLPGVIALGLVSAFLVLTAAKLNDFALWAVILIGGAMMLVDFIQSLREEDEA